MINLFLMRLIIVIKLLIKLIKFIVIKKLIKTVKINLI